MKRSLFETKSDTTTKPSEKKSKYSFWARHPLPDPRWSSEQQLAIGPIQWRVEYSDVRSAFRQKDRITHLFIENPKEFPLRDLWPEEGLVRVGYIVYSDPESAKGVLASGHVMVRGHEVGVKEMDGKSAYELERRWKQTVPHTLFQ